MIPYRHRASIVKRAGNEEETRIETAAEIQPKMGFFPVETDLDAGDTVEAPDPRAGRDVLRYTVAKVDIYSGHGHLDHIEATWGPPPTPQRAPAKRLELANMHSRIAEVAGGLFADEHYAQAVFEAFKAVEVRVRHISGVDEVGAKLIGRAFGGDEPLVSITHRVGKMGNDEQAGRMHILMGAMLAIRNLGAHELEGVAPEKSKIDVYIQEPMTPESAIELLGLASQAMRWLDDAARTL
jgi:uncharacterized protein (TIGR02391 family)